MHSIHTGVAAITGHPGFAIDEQESEMLANAAANVARHYDVALLDEKQKDWCNLFMALGAIYAPRVIVYRSVKSAEKAPRVITPVPVVAPAASNGVLNAH